jgi:exopolyphosphatase/guanosine-5'-triphosphate,3'-diphosphate pyrophosphatase
VSATKVAVIDCGSNSTRLLVADASGSALARATTVTRMAQGVGSTGLLRDDAIERVAGCVTEYLAHPAAQDIDALRVVATSAARDASNRDALFDSLEAVAGVRPRLLSGDEEARLSFTGATASLNPAEGPFLLADIGGGSTELAVGSTEVEGAMSIDVGCVRLTEAHIEHDPPRPEELLDCLSMTEAHIDEMARTHLLAFEAKQLVGVAGTVTTAAAVELGLASYDSSRIHHFRLTREAVEDVFRTVATENSEQRLGNPGLEADRNDVFVAGMCILVEIMRFFDFDDCLVSEADLLDGVARTVFE